MHVINIQFNGFSQTEHTSGNSTGMKKHNIVRIPTVFSRPPSPLQQPLS